MAEDGMLLNFSIGDAPIVQKDKLRGGSWRARRQVERRSRRPSDAPPAKRQRTNDIQPTSETSHPKGPKTEERQVISSLFRFNPSSTTKSQPNTSKTDDDHVEPSNAPLSGELENFTSLGLSLALAVHLTQKLAIKRPTAIQKAAIPRLLQDNSDAFIQAETGSGKTLAYTLPIVQRIIELTPVSSSADVEGKNSSAPSGIHRDSGLFAIILTPTRELSRQVSNVLASILPPYLVSGTVIGGEKKKSEKARLRKGLNILIATPGRLADHLDHTEALDVSRVRWLILDEGDRLMELGFEEDIKRIVSKLDFRLHKGLKDGVAEALPGLPSNRITILCSATMKMDVQRLGEISLKDATHIQASSGDEVQNDEEGEISAAEQTNMQGDFTAPAQLKQSYAVVPAKLRLVTLIAMLKQTFIRRGAVNKVIVFISCADSVDFHFDVFMRDPAEASEPTDDDNRAIETRTKPRRKTTEATKPPEIATVITSGPSLHITPLNSTPSDQVTVYRLHGSLPPPLRTSTLKAFYSSTSPSVLFCTDVASRGLDLPNVDLVIEFDPAFSRDDHIHRVGRTARAGNDGRACVFLMPGVEEGYIDVLARDRREGASALRRSDADEALKKAFASPSVSSNTSAAAMRRSKSDVKDWEGVATNAQLDIERWILSQPSLLEKARKAYQSHIRAYATHVANERQYFDIKELHLGHLAKAFGLRDRPSMVNVPGMRAGPGKKERRYVSNAGSEKLKGEGRKVKPGGFDRDDVAGGMVDLGDAAKKMRSKVKGMMGGADEFNLG
ncbi:putative ATP dependent RNA helicase [Rhizodiscina lignyota]|uniref:ATP-dependent RNA helicase n=1 Tax=Rhizodiscina lignyota TaxID=1504668 RepID=A0A9P4MAE3_9PEZI|nr:putative ATP dependent RNA helicase [Rhizodiscina lignyota]